jgi:hypothetical protein
MPDDFPHTDENIFGIEQADTCQCAVWYYSVSLSVLYLHLAYEKSARGSPSYICFLDVKYFDGPMRWVGANFRVDSSDEYAAVWRKFGAMDAEREIEVVHQMRKIYSLYTVNLPCTKVRILAGSAHTVQKVDEFISPPVA